MKTIQDVGLENVQAVYSGPEGDLWELVMGEQIHIGGFQSSMDLATRAGLKAGQRGIDLCCCNGAGMRFLVRFFNVASMTGVDAASPRATAITSRPILWLSGRRNPSGTRATARRAGAP